MESYIFAIISLLILLPILYLLPLGFTGKGKVLIAVAAFLIGVFGLFAETVFPIWQTALILLLVVSGSAFLMHSRGEKWLYLSENTNTSSSLEKEMQKPMQSKELNDTYSYIADSNKTVKEQVKAPPEKVPPKEKENIEKENTEIENTEIEKPDPNSLLGKLIPQNERELSYFKKPTDEIDLSENDEKELLPIPDDLDEIEPVPFSKKENANEPRPDKETDGDFEINDLDTIQPISVQNETLAAIHPSTEPEPKGNALDGEGELDFDIEELFDDSIGSPEEEKKPQSEINHSAVYLSELEKMLDEEEQQPKGGKVKEEAPQTSKVSKAQVSVHDDFELEELVFSDENPLQLNDRTKRDPVKEKNE